MEFYDVIAVITMTIIALLYGCFKKGFLDMISKKIMSFFFHEPFDGNKITNEFNSVYERLVEIKTILNADRVFIDNFHNGTTFLPNKPVWKITRAYEVAASGVSYTTKEMQNILAVSIWDIITPIFDSKQKKYAEKLKGSICDGSCKNPFGVYRIQVAKMPESFAKVMLRNAGVETFLIVPIIQNDQNIVGYVGVHFLDANDDIFDGCNLCQKVQEISFFINKE